MVIEKLRRRAFRGWAILVHDTSLSGIVAGVQFRSLTDLLSLGEQRLMSIGQPMTQPHRPSNNSATGDPRRAGTGSPRADPTQFVQAFRRFTRALQPDAPERDALEARQALIQVLTAHCVEPIFEIVAQTEDPIARNLWFTVAQSCQRLQTLLRGHFIGEKVSQTKGVAKASPDERWLEIDQHLDRIYELLERIDQWNATAMLRRPLRRVR